GDSDFPEAPGSGGSTTAATVSEAVVQAAQKARAQLDAQRDVAPGREIVAEAKVTPDDPQIKAHSLHSWGAQLCEVKVDPQLPRVQVTRWVSVVDVGRVLNRKLAKSQVLGGVTMGIGMALMEQTVYDRRTGRPVNDNFADYAIPVNADVPEVEVAFVDEPDPVINSLGCRGIGEIGITGVAAAIANAVYHATGKRIRDLPITLDKLL